MSDSSNMVNFLGEVGKIDRRTTEPDRVRLMFAMKINDASLSHCWFLSL